MNELFYNFTEFIKVNLEALNSWDAILEDSAWTTEDDDACCDIIDACCDVIDACCDVIEAFWTADDI